MRHLTTAVLISLLLAAAPAAAQHHTLIDINVADGGPVAIGGVANTTLTDLVGSMNIPVQVATECEGGTSYQAMLHIKFESDDEGYGIAEVSVKSADNDGQGQNNCPDARVADLGQYTLRFQLAAGTFDVAVGGGPLAGLKLTVNAEDGSTADL